MMAGEHKETRRGFLGKLFRFGAGAAVVAAVPGIASAESPPPAEASVNPEQVMRSFLEGHFNLGRLEPNFRLTTLDDTPVAIIYRTGSDGTDLFKGVQIEEIGNGDVNAILADSRMDDRFSRYFNLSGEAQETPWTTSRSEYLQGNPPQSQKLIDNPDGTRISIGTLVTGPKPHRVISQVSWMAPGSEAFQKGTAFINAK